MHKYDIFRFLNFYKLPSKVRKFPEQKNSGSKILFILTTRWPKTDYLQFWVNSVKVHLQVFFENFDPVIITEIDWLST